MIPASATNVLVCLRYGIGDLVMELPVLDALREALPAARITGVAAVPAHELMEEDPRLDRVIPTSRWGLTERWDRGTPEVRDALARWIAGQRFDLILDARHAVAAVAEAIWSLGIQSLESRPERERAVIREGGDGVAAIREAARAGWGLPEVEPRPPALSLRGRDRAFAAAVLGEPGSAVSPVALSPVASHTLKRWPEERFAAVADHVVERVGAPVLILEGPQPEVGRRVVEAMRRPEAAVRVGPYHLLHTAALLERCRAFLANDTGLMHMAMAVGTPTVGIFGPTRAFIFMPPGAGGSAVEPAELDCPHRRTESLFPPECWRRGHCLIAEHGCIDRSPVSAVVAALDRIIDGTAGQREGRVRGTALAPGAGRSRTGRDGARTTG